MFRILKTIAHRLKTLFVVDSALDRKAEFLARHAERKARLMRRALEYDEQGFPEIAEELRCQTAKFSIELKLGRMSSAIGSFAPSARKQSSSEAQPLNGQTPPRSANGTNSKKKLGRTNHATAAR
ncbi:hypothetical protein [Thalassoroseus pseudoceratinae]|uniref:hypothetical protein n=1 Tax=Thalassoroseus pseudoceratinae TaxID=2713176 RepID=UPI0014244879|nr:hypothetical protein [Thalassoroseus pseudoceratinae]